MQVTAEAFGLEAERVERIPQAAIDQLEPDELTRGEHAGAAPRLVEQAHQRGVREGMPPGDREGRGDQLVLAQDDTGLGDHPIRQGERPPGAFRRVLARAGQRSGQLAEQAQGLVPALGELQREHREQASNMGLSVIQAAPGRPELERQGAARGRLVEAAVTVCGMSRDPLAGGDRVVSRKRRGGGGHQTQPPAGEGRRRPERDRLLADQPIEVEHPAIARRRRTDRADERQHEKKACRRNAEEHADVVGDTSEVAQRDASRIGFRHLRVGLVVATGEVLDDGDLAMMQGHHRGADLRVVVGPQQPGAQAAADEDDDEVEAGVIVTGRPGGARIGRRPHDQFPAASLVAVAPDAGVFTGSCGALACAVSARRRST